MRGKGREGDALEVGRERGKEREEMGKGGRGEERMSRTRARFLGWMEIEKGPREGSGHRVRTAGRGPNTGKGVKASVAYAAEIGS